MSHILLFYNGSKLVVLKSTQEAHRIFQARGLPLAEFNAMGVGLAALDHGQTPVTIKSSEARQPFAFTPFGHTDAANLANIGFAGERLDRASDCYLLGAGHRSFSPVLMRFQSPDTQSPFLRGGINAYAYCSSDPVNYSDPSGRIKWLRTIINSISGRGRRRGSESPVPPPYSPADPDVAAQLYEVATRGNSPPPSYFGWGEPPPPYNPNSPLISNGNQARPYRVTPMNGEQVLEMHNGNTRVVNSLVELTRANAQAGNRALPAAASLKATNTLLRMSKNKLPTQTDNGILAAVATAHQLYDIRGAGTMDAPDPAQSLPLTVGITRQT